MSDNLERYLTNNEEKTLFKTVRAYSDIYSRRDANWMQLLRNTGIRVGSLAQLTVEDATEALHLKKLTLSDAICKRSGYSVPVNTKAAQALRKLLVIRREMISSEEPTQALIISRNHKAMAVRSFQQRMQHWRQVAKLNIAVTPHFFRHTVGARIMQHSTARNPLLVVKAALGHASINSSAIYARPNREQIAADFELMS